MELRFAGGVKALALASALLSAFVACADVTVTQTFSLYSGWNAVYMEVSPSAPLTEVFAEWPVKSVGFYDPASFLATRQFSQTWDSDGVSMKPIATWHRDYPDAIAIILAPTKIDLL